MPAARRIPAPSRPRRIRPKGLTPTGLFLQLAVNREAFARTRADCRRAIVGLIIFTAYLSFYSIKVYWSGEVEIGRAHV